MLGLRPRWRRVRKLRAGGLRGLAGPRHQWDRRGQRGPARAPAPAPAPGFRGLLAGHAPSAVSPARTPHPASPVLRVRPQLSPRPRPDLRPLFRSRPERRDGGSDGCEHSSPAACARPRPPPPPRGGRRRLPPWREPPLDQGAAWGPRACGLSPGQENGRKSGGARTGVIFSGKWGVAQRRLLSAHRPVLRPLSVSNRGLWFGRVISAF